MYLLMYSVLTAKRRRTMNPTEPNTCTLSAHVKPSLHTAVKDYAQKWGMTQQEVIIRAVEQYIWDR